MVKTVLTMVGAAILAFGLATGEPPQVQQRVQLASR
jgi:hypothetical protein